MIKAIKFVSVPVTDQDRSLKFFTEKLGFAVATDQPFDGKQRWIEFRIPGAETRLVLFTPDGHEDRVGGFTNLSFLADDIDTTYKQLKDSGVEFAQELKKKTGGRPRSSRIRTATCTSCRRSRDGYLARASGR